MKKHTKKPEWLTDLGSASGRTRGLPFGFFWENVPAPFNLTIFFG
ncbi:MAG TPA: hypothetical protein VGM84_21815 [Steroidobacteraceae bacterium]|jgi:hypothetical protein